MFKFIHQILNPHCEHCARERAEKLEHQIMLEEIRVRENTENQRLELERDESEAHCETCDVLKHELELLRLEKDRLLDKLINPPQPTQMRQGESVMKPISTTRHLPFTARRQALERADREAAQAQRRAAEVTAPAPKTTIAETTIIGDKTPAQSVEELERELDITENA